MFSGAVVVTTQGSVTHWIDQLRDGDSAAAQKLCERYFPQLVRLARRYLQGYLGHVADEEDVALSAMDHFCRAAREGRYPVLADRQELWRLLLRITERRALDLARRQRCRRRGQGKVQQTAARDVAGWAAGSGPRALAASNAPSPEFAAMMAEECRRLLEKLADPQLREIALAKMEGYTNEEIARRLDLSLRTIERRLKLIRDEWRQELR